ncbi:hypothetical protein GCM10010177_30490 [Actinomadura citrea]|nr:hypothetical protein GCM10010177_30490 [Actinomadura citrea]
MTQCSEGLALVADHEPSVDHQGEQKQKRQRHDQEQGQEDVHRPTITPVEPISELCVGADRRSRRFGLLVPGDAFGGAAAGFGEFSDAASRDRGHVRHHLR